jgi:hypothetical protein
MKKFSLAVLFAAILIGAPVFAQDSQVFSVKHDLISSVEVTLLDDIELPFNPLSTFEWENDCTKLEKTREQRLKSVDPVLDEVINIGKQVWEIIKNNGPVVEAKTMSGHALPRGIQCWDELSGWQMPRAQSYQVSYKNGYGMEVVKFRFRLIYTYGGGFKGVGQYLTNASVQYSDINVLWGYIFNAYVEIPQVINMGRHGEPPLAGMQLTVNWDVNTRPINLKRSINATTFFIAGDGRKTEILD